MSNGLCLKCGGETDMGYGLAGGGMGPYVFCQSCDYFKKFQDAELDTPPKEPRMNAEIADLKRAFTAGEIERADIIEVLQEDFDMSEEDAISLIDSWMEEEE